MSHTSGPWMVDASHVRYAINTPGYPKDGVHIAMVNVSDKLPLSESLANAHLMAAAPDMLAKIEQQRIEIRSLKSSLRRLETWAAHLASAKDKAEEWIKMREVQDASRSR